MQLTRFSLQVIPSARIYIPRRCWSRLGKRLGGHADFEPLSYSPTTTAGNASAAFMAPRGRPRLYQTDAEQKAAQRQSRARYRER
jgi:hypothetical protein